MVPTRKVDETGRYLVIVNKDNIQRVRDKLKNKFDQWYADAVPEDARPRTGQYAGPPAVGTPRSENFSEGDQSWLTSSTRSFMSFSVASMEANGVTTKEQQHLDRTWESSIGELSGTQGDQHSKTQSRKTHKSYAAAAAATGFDQVSGITESDPTPRDAIHEELSLKIASLEAMILTLYAQVQALTSSSQTTTDVSLAGSRDTSKTQEKRQNTNSTPRKQKGHMTRQQTQQPKKVRNSRHP